MSDARHPTRPYLDHRTPVEGVSTEEVRALARQEAEAEGRRQQEECVREGPVCAIWKEIGTMRVGMDTLRIEQTKLLAVLGFWKWALPIVVTVVGILAGVVVPRLWPVQPAHGAQVVTSAHVEAAK